MQTDIVFRCFAARGNPHLQEKPFLPELTCQNLLSRSEIPSDHPPGKSVSVLVEVLPDAAERNSNANV